MFLTRRHALNCLYVSVLVCFYCYEDIESNLKLLTLTCDCVPQETYISQIQSITKTKLLLWILWAQHQILGLHYFDKFSERTKSIQNKGRKVGNDGWIGILCGGVYWLGSRWRMKFRFSPTRSTFNLNIRQMVKYWMYCLCMYIIYRYIIQKFSTHFGARGGAFGQNTLCLWWWLKMLLTCLLPRLPF